VRHNWIDNLQGQLFGVVMIAFGMSMLHSLGLIIGQVAGVAFLVSYATGVSFGTAFALINLPFYLLAALRMGAAFTWRTLAAVTAVSVLTNIAGNYISYSHLDPLVGAVLAGLCVGIGLIGLVAIFSTLVLGRMSDQVERRNILAAIYLVRGLGFFALVMVGAHWELYAAATIGGIVWAGSVALSSAILADVYGIRVVGVLYGLAYLGHQVGGMISSWLGGWAYETFGTHWVAFGSAGALLLAAALISLRLPARGLLSGQAAAAGSR